MDEFLCVTLFSHPGEPLPKFKTRLAEFWTHMIRNKPDDYERVYCESREFEQDGARTIRQYMVEIAAWPVFEAELRALKMNHEPVDTADTYNRDEASTSEWFQIPHD